MPDTDTEDEPYVSRTQQRKIDAMNHLARGAGFAVLLLAAAFLAWFAFNVPGHPWRQNDTPLPWRGEGVIVEEAQVQWNSSKGDERLELRALLYPTVKIKLGNCTGSGYLHAVFKDPAGHQVGNISRIPYRDGEFIETSELTVQASGKEAVCHIETGILDKDSYVLHKMNVDEPLWRVEIRNEPNGKYEQEVLGHRSIPAVDFPGL